MAKNKNFHAAASTGAGMNATSFFPTMFNNPYNDQDYDILEDLWAHTLAGTTIDTKGEFVVGEEVTPSFELLDTKITDEDEKIKELDKFDEILNELKAIDQRPTIRLNDHVPDLYRNAKVFGRACLAFEGSGARAIPTALKPLHSRDLGRVFVHQLDWSLSSVRAFQKGDNIKDEEMIYLVHMPNSPRYRSLHYGYSEIQRMVGPARALRRILEFDVVETVEALWASHGLVVVDQDGLTPAEKTDDLNIIKNNVKAGAFSFVSGKKDEIQFFPLDTSPKVAELMTVTDKLEQMIIGNAKVPAPLLGREEEANMATLLGKIRLFLSGPVESDRRWLGKTLSGKWWERNIIKLGHKSILNEVRVVANFKPIIIESWVDNVDALQKLRNLIPSLTDETILDLARLPELKGKLDKTMENGTKDPAEAAAIIQENTDKTTLKKDAERVKTENKQSKE